MAGNAAFVIGPRRRTAHLDLQRRVFLHSYDPDGDPDGSALETILTAPLVVAQWINAQYYFSTVAPDVFGAGTKTVHNVIAGVGVLAGHNGDLQLGLPWQSVAVGEQLRHEPMRLLTVVHAPLPRIARIIDRNPVLQHLTGNQWITLTARDHPGDPWQRYTPHGWEPEAAGSVPPAPTTTDPRPAARHDRPTGEDPMTRDGLTKMTKIEVVVTGADAPAVREMFQAAGATGYTGLSGVSGLGHHGHHEGRLLFNQQATLELLITVVPDSAVTDLLAGLRPLLAASSGVMFVSDTYVSRPDYFT